MSYQSELYDIVTPTALDGDVDWYRGKAKSSGGPVLELGAGTGRITLAVAADGAVWFAMLRRHALGRFHRGAFKEFPLPRADARPVSVAVDSKGNIWYVDLAGWVGALSAETARAP